MMYSAVKNIQPHLDFFCFSVYLIVLYLTDLWPDVLLQGLLAERGMTYDWRKVHYYFSGIMFGFHQIKSCLPNSFDSSVNRTVFQRVWGSSRCVVGKSRWALMFFWVSSGFCLATLPWMPFLSSVYWINNFIDVREAYSSLKVLLASFLTSWVSHHHALWLILEGQPLLLWFTVIPSPLHL